jgi:hypothetical protein
VLKSLKIMCRTGTLEAAIDLAVSSVVSIEFFTGVITRTAAMQRDFGQN